VTVGSLSGAPSRRAAPLVERRPALFEPGPLEPASALGRLFGAEWIDRSEEEAAALLGDWRPALGLLPRRERRRAALLALWLAALRATAREGDPAERRRERLNRSSFLLAKSLAGERSASPFAALLAAESAARTVPRRALDLLLADARAGLDGAPPPVLALRRARAELVGGATAEALLGHEPSPAIVDAAAALLRLALLARLAQGRSERAPLLPLAPPGAEPAALVAAVLGEAADVRAQLLRGARALAEVPLGYRRALAYLTTAALDLVGRIEEHPAELLRRPPRAGRLRRLFTLWRARRIPLD
jgi:hypothetical protein